MLEADGAGQMVALHEMGWGLKRIGGEPVVVRDTVRRCMAAGGYVHYRALLCLGKLDGLETATSCARGLLRAHSVAVSLRTVERACRSLRAELGMFRLAKGQKWAFPLETKWLFCAKTTLFR